jgi:hypothetical protein
VADTEVSSVDSYLSAALAHAGLTTAMGDGGATVRISKGPSAARTRKSGPTGQRAGQLQGSTSWGLVDVAIAQLSEAHRRGHCPSASDDALGPAECVRSTV